MHFPLFLPLWAETRETFCLGFPDHLIKQSCGSSFRFPLRVSVDVHCGTYIRVSEQFLHILWCWTVWEQIACECVSQHMKMEIFKSFQFLFCRPCHNTNCTRWLVCSVRSQADKGYFLVSVRHFIRSRQAVDFIVSTVFFFDLFVVVEVIEFSILEAVLMLFRLCLLRMSARVSQKSTVRTFLRLVAPISVLCLCPLYRILRRTVRYCPSRLMSCQVNAHASPIRSPV